MRMVAWEATVFVIEKNILGTSESRMIPMSENYTKADLRHIAETLIIFRRSTSIYLSFWMNWSSM